MNEAQTRKRLIDSKLGSAGWITNDRTRVIEEYDIVVGAERVPGERVYDYSGHLFCDYVLLGKDGKPLAVVEAKRTSSNAETGREQAKQYCERIHQRLGGKTPFCFYTNGYEIFLWDLGIYPPRKVAGFPTRDDLERLLFLREHRQPLADELIDTSIVDRDYQIRAIRAVMETVEKKKRKFLLVMATGTGKTRTCVALIDALMRAGHAERTLFLVDRIALKDQAVDAFKEHLPNEPYWPKAGETSVTDDRRIYVSTYPTMLNIIRSEDNPLSAHFFDLVVIDESHRSIYNTYQEILSYFDALELGMTATPTNLIDHNTFGLFDCDDGLPTFAYSYEEAVTHSPPYLCELEVMKIHTKFQEQGISKRTISLEEQKQLILEGKEIEEIDFKGTDIEKKVINKGTNVLIVREFMEECVKDGNGVLPGKTIFFCASMSHARRMEIIFDELYPEYCGELAKVIVSDDSRVYGKGGLLDQFKKNDMPRVAISVDMLDTGIDVREIVNLVFAKPVYSYTKFWQMIGRGTRLLERNKIKPWCPAKDRFLVIDCWDNFEYFKLNPKGKEIAPQVPLPVRFFGIRLDKIEKAIDSGKPGIAGKETAKLKEQIKSLPKNSVVIGEAASDLSKIADDNFWVRLDHGKIEYLRNSIKPLFRTISQADFKAMRFEKDALETSLALLSGEKAKFESLAAGLVELIFGLPLSVNVVAGEEELIRKAQTSRYWKAATDSDLDELAIKLSPLMKYREPVSLDPGPARFNFKDMLHTKEMVEFGPELESVSIARYREMVEALVRELLARNPVLRKIMDGKPVSEKEASELADELHRERPHVTEELLQRAYNNRKAHFLQFMRHILGLEKLDSFPEMVETAFDDFIRTHSYLNSRQHEFLNLLREYILERERIEKRDLIGAPFTLLHPNGIRGLFSPAEIEEIVQFTDRLAG
jgi:type I restriction enzyme R subunit